MTGKIFRAILAAAGGVLLACVIIIFGCLYEYFGSVQLDRLWAELDMAAAGVEAAGTDYLSALDPDTSRLTWISPDGAVLFDAHADRQAMENHASREEVRQALTTGTGTSQRYSSTLLEKTIYCARRLSDGSVLRISVSQATMAVLALGMLQPICVVVAVALILAFFLANGLAKRIVQPLNTLDLDHPLENQTYDELAPLLRRISQQSSQITAQLRQLRHQEREFAQITDSMNEGLVLLSGNQTILSINPAARRILGAPERCVGRDFLTLDRSPELQKAIADARDTGHSELTLQRSGRIYQVDTSRSGSQTPGTVMLIFDVTEKVDGERSRREFTANVSHELKTPLTAILGSSELLQSGMVKPEDSQRFLGHIHDEAARLLTLIEDILRLSQLDEGVALPEETFDLGALVRETAGALEPMARGQGLTLEIQAEACPMRGVPRLYREIVRNLTENAIKYNRPGGSVKVTLDKEGVLTVADTGIGIPSEEQSRVFERFYRVDKSHSRQVGGTGLGLSIVKHAAAYLGATLQLESQPNLGTTLRLTPNPAARIPGGEE